MSQSAEQVLAWRLAASKQLEERLAAYENLRAAAKRNIQYGITDELREALAVLDRLDGKQP